MHRRRRHRKSATVDLNLAAMLDMAFQLLTFFILTFRPAPIEGQLGLHLPPPIPLTKVKTEAAADNAGNGGDANSEEALDLYVNSNEQGQVSQIKAGLRSIVKGRLDKRNIEALNHHLKTLFVVQKIPIDRVQLIVDERLRYEELMKIVDVCTRQTLSDGKPLQRISFVEMKNQGNSP